MNIGVASSTNKPRLSKIECTYSIILPVSDDATNFVTVDGYATIGCILDLCKTGAPAMKIEHPVTDFWYFCISTPICINQSTMYLSIYILII